MAVTFGTMARRRLLLLVPSALLAAGLSLALAPQALAFPPDVPPKAQVQSELNGLTVRTEGSMSGYSRDKFPHCHTVTGACNTREQVLKRDGTDPEHAHLADAAPELAEQA